MAHTASRTSARKRSVVMPRSCRNSAAGPVPSSSPKTRCSVATYFTPNPRAFSIARFSNCFASGPRRGWVFDSPGEWESARAAIDIASCARFRPRLSRTVRARHRRRRVATPNMMCSGEMSGWHCSTARFRAASTAFTELSVKLRKDNFARLAETFWRAASRRAECQCRLGRTLALPTSTLRRTPRSISANRIMSTNGGMDILMMLFGVSRSIKPEIVDDIRNLAVLETTHRRQ